jgi:hypothetical protein
MDDAINLINKNANFTSAGTSQSSILTPEGVEHMGVENISSIDEYYKKTDLGRYYKDHSERFIKIQKINFLNHYFYICYIIQNENIEILKFDNEGKLIDDANSEYKTTSYLKKI